MASKYRKFNIDIDTLCAFYYFSNKNMYIKTKIANSGNEEWQKDLKTDKLSLMTMQSLLIEEIQKKSERLQRIVILRCLMTKIQQRLPISLLF